MKNHNIKAILLDERIVNRNIDETMTFLHRLKKFGTVTVVLKDENCTDNRDYEGFEFCIRNCDFAGISEVIRIPVFHCVVFSADGDMLTDARKNGFKTVCVGNENNIKKADLFALKLSDIDIEAFLEFSKIKPHIQDEYNFIENGFDTADIKHIESIFALSNGYIGLRGTYDECDEDLQSAPGMYINGVFETEPLKFLCYNKGFPLNDQCMVNLFDWRIFEVYIDGEKACPTSGNIVNHKRRLDFKTGMVERTFDFKTKSGKTISVESHRLVNMVRVHGAEIRYTVRPLNFSGEVYIKSSIVKNTLTDGKLMTRTVGEKLLESGITVELETIRTKMRAACSVEHRVGCKEFEISVNNIENVCEWIIKAQVGCGETVTVEKYASFYSSIDNIPDIAEAAEREANENSGKGFEYFAKEQADFWAEHWKNGDIVIDGNLSDQQAVRFSLFQLRQQLPEINDVSIGANGLTGSIYRGKVFWDTEMYLMPYYLYTYPQGCKKLIKYRCGLLDKARERAKQLGSVGALYSWASIDGEETSVVHEASTAEYHINSDIAYSVFRYCMATGEWDFLYDECAEMLFETAKFTAHRGNFIEAYGNRFCINSVCGPDEYACGVNNNCYTNFMAQFHLRFAVSVYNEMKKNRWEQLDRILNICGIDADEIALWERAADSMYYRINDRYNIYEQDDSFVYNDPVDMEMIPKNFDIRWLYHPLDLWRLQVLKQADVLMLMFVLSDRFTLDEKKSNYDYYEPKTNHGSSLSTVIHSIMANEIGYFKDAYEYFRCTAYMDIADVKKNTSGGLHIACIGGVWMSVVHGFLGMRMCSMGLEFNVSIPEEWNKCICRIRYRDAVIEVSAEKTETKFTLEEGTKAEFSANGEKVKLCGQNQSISVKNTKRKQEWF